MPKRQNPFDDVAPLQYKTHVRCKEVELGDKTKMRAIFGTWNFPFYNIVHHCFFVLCFYPEYTAINKSKISESVLDYFKLI